ncbi:MAG: DinB family protein, partial [Egibacteraceae bacterium]
ELARPCGPVEGPFSEEPFAALILHLNREAIHHGAEIALLRDLYRAGLAPAQA